MEKPEGLPMVFIDNDPPDSWSVFCARWRSHKELGLAPAGQVYPPPEFLDPAKHRRAKNNKKSEDAKIYRRLEKEAALIRNLYAST
jgi:uncharacterized protein (DUF2237 family)